MVRVLLFAGEFDFTTSTEHFIEDNANPKEGLILGRGGGGGGGAGGAGGTLIEVSSVGGCSLLTEVFRYSDIEVDSVPHKRIYSQEQC